MNTTEKTWFIDENIQMAQFMNEVNNASLKPQVKDFLRYVATKATWRHSSGEKSFSPCFASQDTIEIQMNRSRNFITKAKKEALRFGWIMVHKTEGSSDLIFPRIGIDDPSITKKIKRQRWEGIADPKVEGKMSL